MSDSMKSLAELGKAAVNESNTFFKKEGIARANKDLVSQEQLAILAYLHSFGRTKPKDDPEAEKKRKQFTGRIKLFNRVYEEKPADGSVLEPVYNVEFVSFWTDDILVPGQFVVAIGNKTTKNYRTSYYIRKLIPLDSSVKDLFENVAEYLPATQKGGSK